MLLKLRSLLRRNRRVDVARSEEHTSELQSLRRISYAVFCLKKPKKTQVNAPQVEEPIKKKEKIWCCYLCRGKGHFASSCTTGTLSNPILIDDVYSLRKDRIGNMFVKYVGTQSGVKKRTIWVAKPIVTNLLGPNLVGDHQTKTWSIGVVGGHLILGYIMKN